MPPKPRADLPEPPTPLDGLSDSERKIGKVPVFSLADVKAHIEQYQLNGLNIANPKADYNLQHDLRWRLSDLCGFISCLEPHHYRYSEWVYGSKKGKVAFPADVYIMGYNRIQKKEWPQSNPWNYFKFSFSLADNTIEIFSIHPEEK